MHISPDKITTSYSCEHTEQAKLNVVLLRLCNHGESLTIKGHTQIGGVHILVGLS